MNKNLQYHDAITYFEEQQPGANGIKQFRLVFKTTGVIFQSCLLDENSDRIKNIWTQILMDRASRHLLGKTQLDGVYKLSESLYQVT